MHLFSEFQEIQKMGDAKKNVSNAERTFSERMEPVRGQSVAWRSRYVRKTSKSSAKSPDIAHSVSWISHFRPGGFWTVGTPDVHRATRNDGPGWQQDSRVPGNASRDTCGILIKSGIDMSIRNGISFEW